MVCASVGVVLLTGAPSVSAAPLVSDLDPITVPGVGGYLEETVVLPAVAGAPIGILVADHRGQQLVLLRAGGGGRFQVAQRVGAIRMLALATDDLDGDGLADVVTAGTESLAGGNASRPALDVHWGEPGGVIGAGTSLLRGDKGQEVTSAVAVADFNGDGMLDIALRDYERGVITPGNLTTSLTVLLNRGARRFDPVPSPAVANFGDRELRGGDSLLVGDVNGDPHPDLIFRGGALLGDGQGRFTARRDWPDLDGAAGIGDVTGDGLDDLVVVGEREVLVRRGSSSGLRSARATKLTYLPGSDTNNLSVGHVTVGDLDGDGRAEVVLSGFPNVAVLRGTRSGRLGSATSHGPFAGVEGLAVGDADGDGRADVVLAQRSEIVVLRNRGRRRRSAARLFGSPTIIPAARGALVGVRCSRGAGRCYGSVVVRHGSRTELESYELPGGRSRRPLVRIGRLRPGARLTVTLRRDGSRSLKRRARARVPRRADLRASCAPNSGRFGDSVGARGSTAVVLVGPSDNAEACVFATGRRLPLDLDFARGPFYTAGRWVVGFGFTCEGFECFRELDIRQLRGGGVDSVVEVSDGTRLAWLACSRSLPRGKCPGPTRDVLALDKRGIVRVARGRGIAGRSLRAAADGGSFSWLQRGKRRSARWVGSRRVP